MSSKLATSSVTAVQVVKGLKASSSSGEVKHVIKDLRGKFIGVKSVS